MKVINVLSGIMRDNRFTEENLPELLIGTVGLAFLFTLYLTALEFFAIGLFCQYCVISAVIVLMMFILAISYLRTTRTQA